MKACISISGKLLCLWNTKKNRASSWRTKIKFVCELTIYEPSSPSTKELHGLPISLSLSLSLSLTSQPEISWTRFPVLCFRWRFSNSYPAMLKACRQFERWLESWLSTSLSILLEISKQRKKVDDFFMLEVEVRVRSMWVQWSWYCLMICQER